MKDKLKVGRFWSTIITLVVIYAIVKWGIPIISRQITGMPFPLPVPGTLILFYMVLTIIALFIYISFSEERFQEFLSPTKRLLAGDYGKNTRTVILAIVPLFVGWQVYATTVPKVSSPTALRIQHPSSNFPKAMEALKNPLANPTEAEVDAFIKQAKDGKVEFIQQVRADMARWQEANPKSHQLAFIPTEPMNKFLSELQNGNVSNTTVRNALLEKYLFEGRALFAMNCRPCHGDSTAGDGPMADGFKLRPINFTDNGTIETIVEGYTFWRVSTGGPGLPSEATPWDSAMPTWNLNLTEEERWKIILAEYDLAQKTPRQPEKVETAEKKSEVKSRKSEEK